jgi:CheY-like chemotaxis protein
MMVLDHSAGPPIVLVVEDEMLLRMRAVDMVQDAGYTSVEAVDADAAFAILESRSDVALLFTDVQMPGSMDGLKLAHAVFERWPPIKIILVSGQLNLSKSDIPPNSRFFGKPLVANEVIAEMRDMIGDTRPAAAGMGAMEFPEEKDMSGSGQTVISVGMSNADGNP